MVHDLDGNLGQGKARAVGRSYSAGIRMTSDTHIAYCVNLVAPILIWSLGQTRGTDELASANWYGTTHGAQGAHDDGSRSGAITVILRRSLCQKKYCDDLM
jgi:hypothetical protein